MSDQPRKIVFRSILSPGDAMTLTAALESLHQTYPGQFLTDVRTSTHEIFENNPHITKLTDNESEVIDIHYPTVHKSSQHSVTFINGYLQDIAGQLKVELKPVTNRPHLYFTDEEKKWINQIRENFSKSRDIPFWIVNAGIKSDFTAKQWPVEFYQKVIDETIGLIQWVQIGDRDHSHPELKNCIDCRGKTDHRQLMRMTYHADGALGPVTYLQHICAALEKPYICLLGGRESVTWVQYPKQMTLHTIGQLDCCKNGGCWKSRVIPLGDSDEKDKSVCQHPILGMQRPIAKCMAMIKPIEVISILNRFQKVA